MAAQNGLLLWLFAMAALLGWRILTDSRMTRGLLSERDGRGLAPERVQALAISVSVVGMYVLSGVHELQAGRFAEASPELLSIMAGSQAVYLTGKVARSIT